MPLQTGQTLLNKYRIERMIGEGGFGYVHQAIDLRAKIRVAIKELKPDAANDRTVLTRFVNEARAVQAINDPRIVSFFDYINLGQRHYIVLEFMDGGSLADLIKFRGMLTVAEATKIASAVCDGLAAVHNRGIVHRDIKPSNVLVTGGGRTVKIGDFGIAHVPSALGGMTKMTRTGMTMGTPWYMSPEQARGEQVDARSDLYSVGVMLYEMCAGYMYLDFTGDMFRDVELVKTALPRPLPAIVPHSLREIISISLAKQASGRYRSAGEMSAALRPSTSSETVIAIPRRPHAQTPTPSFKRRESPMALMVGGAITIVLFVLVLAFVLASRGSVMPTVNTAISGSNVSSQPTANLAASANIRVTQVALAPTTNAAATAIVPRATATTIVLTPTPTRTSTPAPTFTPTTRPTLAPTPRPTGNCSDPGAQLSFQDGYRPDTYFHIMGSAKAPNFQFYLVEYADRTDNPKWNQLRDPVRSQVDNAELAEWVLPTVGGHQWFVRVTVYLNDGTTLAPCARWIQQR